MKITTRGKNALKFMLDLATYSREQPVRLKDIARRQHVSEKYLEQIVSGIQKAALVQSSRDAAINSVLEEITLKDMLEWQYGLLIDQYVI